MDRVGNRDRRFRRHLTWSLAVAAISLLSVSACKSNASANGGGGGGGGGSTKSFCAGKSVTLEAGAVGDNGDVQMRAMAPALSKELGCDVKVVDAPGGNSDVAQDQVHSAHPDGRTIGFLTISKDVLAEGLGKSEIHFALDDVKFIASTEGAPNAIVITPNSPYKTFVDLLNADPPAKMLTSTATSSGGMTMQLLFAAYGKKPDLIAGYSGGQIGQGLLRGDAYAAGTSLSTLEPLVTAGKIQVVLMDVAVQPGSALATKLKDVPLYADLIKSNPPPHPEIMQHLIDYRTLPSDWFFVPKGTPDDVLKQLQDAFEKVLKDPDVMQKLLASGVYGYIPGSQGLDTVKKMELIIPDIKKYVHKAKKK